MTKRTPAWAKQKLDEDIQAAHARYERRLAAIRASAERAQNKEKRDELILRQRDTAILALKRSGMSYADISRLIGLHREYVRIRAARAERYEREKTQDTD